MKDPVVIPLAEDDLCQEHWEACGFPVLTAAMWVAAGANAVEANEGVSLGLHPEAFAFARRSLLTFKPGAELVIRFVKTTDFGKSVTLTHFAEGGDVELAGVDLNAEDPSGDLFVEMAARRESGFVNGWIGVVLFRSS